MSASSVSGRNQHTFPFRSNPSNPKTDSNKSGGKHNLHDETSHQHAVEWIDIARIGLVGLSSYRGVVPRMGAISAHQRDRDCRDGNRRVSDFQGSV